MHSMEYRRAVYSPEGKERWTKNDRMIFDKYLLFVNYTRCSGFSRIYVKFHGKLWKLGRKDTKKTKSTEKNYRFCHSIEFSPASNNFHHYSSLCFVLRALHYRWADKPLRIVYSPPYRKWSILPQFSIITAGTRQKSNYIHIHLRAPHIVRAHFYLRFSTCGAECTNWKSLRNKNQIHAKWCV